MPYPYATNLNMPYLNAGLGRYPTYGLYNTPSVSSPSNNTSNNTPTESYSERMARITREEREKYQKKEQERKAKEMELPLTESESKAIKEDILVIDAQNNKKAQSSVATALAFPALFSFSTLKSALKPSKYTVNMFYKDGASHMNLFSANADLMGNAQTAMQKLERKFAKDIKVRKGDAAGMKHVVEERNFFRDIMQEALASGDQKEIAKATAICQKGASAKNGWLRRLFRGLRKQDKLVNRFDSVANADLAGQFKSVQVPKTETSFLKNMFSSKFSIIMALSMVVMPFVSDWKNIKQARAVDKENKAKGEKTNYGGKQITQTSLRAGASFLAYNVVDTAVRTIIKRNMGKIAAKIATKGVGKVLGGVLGSVAPGLGTVLGMFVGAGLDFVLNKFVFGKMKFFNNSGVKEATVAKADDATLISELSNSYMMGEKVSDKSLAVLKKKLDDDSFKKLKELHDMPEDKRNEAIAQMQAQVAEAQQALAAQQAAETQQKA